MKKILKPTPSDRWTARFVMTIVIAYLIWTFSVAMARHFIAPISASLAVMLIPVFLVDGIKTVIESFTPKKTVIGSEDISKVTVVIPSFNGGKHIHTTLEDLIKRFPKKQIIVSSNGSNDNTCEVVKSYGVRLLEIAEPIGKVEAINRALHMVKTPYTLIMDDDTLIGNAVIPTSSLDEGNGGVAFRVYPIKNGFWSLLQLHEYRKSMDVGRRYHNHSTTVQNISGAIGLYRNSELIRQAKIHTGEFSGEDLQRTLLVHLSRKNSGGVVMSESIVETLAPDTFASLFKQRVYGWYPGFLANFHLYWKLLFMRGIPKRLRFEAFFNCVVLTMLDPIRLLSLPILLFNPVYLLFFYVVYVLLETIPWIVTGRNEPYWVILIFPVYGLFNFITRMLSASVFFYRRITKIVGHGVKNDDYKFVTSKAKLIGVLTSSLLTLLFVFTYGGILTATSNYEAILEVPQPELKLIVIKAEPLKENTEEVQDTNRIYEITVKAGDSRWTVGRSAINQYLVANKILMPQNKIELATFWLISEEPTHGVLSPGDTQTIASTEVQKALAKAAY